MNDPRPLTPDEARRRTARRRMMRRRRRTLLLALLLLLGFVGFRVVANDDGELDPAQVTPAPLESSSPDGDPQASAPGRNKDGLPIKHVVFIVKENRTYDNYFGRYPHGDGATTGRTSGGRTIQLSIATDVLEPDLGHSFLQGVEAVNGGRMNGFDLVKDGESLNGYSAFERNGIPNYWAYADNFVLGDRMFSSTYGPTLPGHLYAIGAQAAGVVGNKLDVGGPGGYCADRDETVHAFRDVSGKRRGTLVAAVRRSDSEKIAESWRRVRACFDFRTMPDLLDKRGLSWRYYDEDGSWFNAILAIDHLYKSRRWGPNVVPQTEFVPDVRDGNLARVTWLMPGEGNNEHPGGPSVCAGENWTVNVVNAIMQS
ncbi:MAG TPA: alkaline phosphatase family protein, partial [Actinomycetota bacterium]